MNARSTFASVCAVLVLSAAAPAQLTQMEELGKALFFDANLSTPPGQSCAACHAPETGFTGPISVINAAQSIYPGAVHVRTGNRKPPTAAYAGDSPPLSFDPVEGLWIGGMFWDGRATGMVLGDPLAEQAQGPFLNPVEQNNPNFQFVVRRVAMSGYAQLFEQVWGPGSLDWRRSASEAYEQIAFSIAAYERSSEVNPFSSKFDYWLRGQAVLTPLEDLGRRLFEGKAMCANCHLSQPGPAGEPPLFTDFTYDNVGTPKNPYNPFYSMPPSINPDGADWVDPGLGGFLEAAGFPSSVYVPEMGKHKVPTLRNVDRRPYPGFVKAFAHNGFFRSLEEIVHFYNTRDVPGAQWPPPEEPRNVNTDELGDLGLTANEEIAIVAFLKTLSDGYTP